MAWADGPLVNTSRMSWGRSFKDETVHFECYPVSWNFLDFMGIEVVEGRDFTRSDERCCSGVYIFNETAKRNFGMKLSDKLTGHLNVPTEIVGFCEDFQFKPLQYNTSPFAFYVMGREPWRIPSYLYIRSTPGASYSDVKSAVMEVVADIVPGYDREKVYVRLFEEELSAWYANERQLIRLVTLFSFVTILISLTGIVGLLMYETAFRKKEVAVRRVQGATVKEILELFNRKYLMILLVSFMIAVPVSWLLMDHYLESFACRIRLGWWVFVAAMLVVSLVTVLVVTLCTWRSANLNPAESLKDE